MWMKMTLLQVVRMRYWCRNTSLHVSDQMVMLMSVLFMSLHLPLCHLYDCRVMTMDWTTMRMKMTLLQVVRLQNWCRNASASDQIAMFTSVLLLSMHPPLSHLYDCCLTVTVTEWTEMMMRTSLLSFHLLLRHWYDC